MVSENSIMSSIRKEGLHEERSDMLTIKELFEMEQKLKDSISPGFFEDGIHNQKDLIFYEAYSAVQHSRMILEEFEKQLDEAVDEVMEEMRAKGMIS